jgi:hypothetical protein
LEIISYGVRGEHRAQRVVGLRHPMAFLCHRHGGTERNCKTNSSKPFKWRLFGKNGRSILPAQKVPDRDFLSSEPRAARVSVLWGNPGCGTDLVANGNPTYRWPMIMKETVHRVRNEKYSASLEVSPLIASPFKSFCCGL